MKHVTILAAIAATAFAACGGPAADPNTDTAAANQKTFVRLMSAWDSGDAAIFDSLIADNFVDHNPDPNIPTTGKQSWKDQVALYRASFPDMKGTPNVVFAGGDWVAGCASVSGTNSGATAGMPATNKAMKDVTSIDLCRFENGKLVERWGLFDYATMMMQLGLMGGAHTDSTMTSMEGAEHKCGTECKDGNHVYAHGEKGHTCGEACHAVMDKKS